jgi:epsilon-lactone hydrolase
MQPFAVEGGFLETHPLDADDAVTMAGMRAFAKSTKGLLRGKEARKPFDALMESVVPRQDLTFELDTVGGIPGIWTRPAGSRSDEAIIHLHGGWFNFGSATAYRHLVGQVAARVGVPAFIPDYRLAPEHPFPAAVNDAVACYHGLEQRQLGRIAVTGDSAGGNLALVLAARIVGDADSSQQLPVALAVFSPVTDLTLSGSTYETRADADPYFTRAQVIELVNAYLGTVDPRHPDASPLHGNLSGLPPISIHVGDDEVLLDDSRRYVDRAWAAGVEATLDVWMGMPHGFVGNVGTLKAAAQALDASSAFVATRMHAVARPDATRPLRS